VEDLSRRRVIRTPAVREAFLRVPRERFVPEVAGERGLEAVYRDEPLITKMDQGCAVSSSSQPAIMAEMLERLDLAPGQRVLEIGAGTGYNAALLSDLAGDVVTLDVDAELAETARRRLAEGGHSAEVAVGDGMAGWPDGAPYDRIIVTATPPYIPTAWRDQLRPGGLLEVPTPLGHDNAVVFLVTTFRRDGDELVSTAIVAGGFMGFRSPDGRRPDYPQPTLGWYDRTGRQQAGLSITGGALAKLSGAARRRLLGALVAGPRRTGLGRGADVELFLSLVCAADPRRLVAVYGADQRLGLVDERGGMAVLRYRWQKVERIEVVGAECYGDPGPAERDLRQIVSAWQALGRPALEDFEVRVAFGRPPRGATWRLPSGGEARIGVSVRRQSG
jgi:protein-L-isoaspartate(D-aspartate) O-methyltransferase